MAESIHITADIVNGKLPEHARARITTALAGLNGKRVSITIAKFVKRRSSNQNRFMHGPFLKALRGMFLDGGRDYSAKQVKEIFKRQFGFTELLELPSGEQVEVQKSTADYTTVECEEAMEKARAWAAEFGFFLPIPNEQTTGGSYA